MEASAIQAPAGLARTRTSLGTSLLRLRSDDQLVALFRAGDDGAFRAIYDRYKQRMFAYTRQMLSSSRPDAEDALQDIFMRAYVGLRASDRELSLRPWLYRIAHNRCVDELRRPLPPPPEVLSILRAPIHDPTVQAEQRESLRRLIDDVRRLPDQQRSALLMRELGGMPYADVAAAIEVSVPAVKSLLVRARIGLAQAAEARDTACFEIQEALVLAHERGVRPSGQANRHMHDCVSCRAFRKQLRGTSRQLAALAPTLGPLGVLAKLLGVGGGATGGAAAAGSGAGAAAASGGLLAGGLGHVTALLAAAAVTAGGAVELQHTISATSGHVSHHRASHRAIAAGTAAAPAASGINPVTASGSTPVATPPSTPVSADRATARSSAKTKLAADSSTPSPQSSSGGAANVGASSSGGADASGGSVSVATTSTSLGSAGASPSGSSTTTGTDGGTGSTATGSSAGLGSTTTTTGSSGSSGSQQSTTGSTGSGSTSAGLGSSSGSSTAGQPAQAPITRLSL